MNHFRYIGCGCECNIWRFGCGPVDIDLSGWHDRMRITVYVNGKVRFNVQR